MKILIALLLVLQTSTIFGNGIKVGFDTIGKHKATDIELDDYNLGNMNNDAENGFSIAFQSMPNFNEKISFGFGVEYMIGRSTEDFEGDFNFENLFLIIYQTISTEEPIFFSGRIGYGLFEADDTYKGDGLTTLKGGLYYGYGGGYKIDEKLSIEAVYTHNFGKYDSYILFVGDSKYNLEYTRLNISLIYSY